VARNKGEERRKRTEVGGRGGEAGGLIGRKLSARAILRRIRDSPGSYPSRPLLDSSDVHRLPGVAWPPRGSPLRGAALRAEREARVGGRVRIPAANTDERSAINAHSPR